MKIRYCETILQQWKPCDVGCGSMDKDGMKSCCDEPVEDNCHLIVETSDPVICPTCGTAIGIIGDF